MDRKQKAVMVVAVLLVVGLLAWFSVSYHLVPRLSVWEKQKVCYEFFEKWRWGNLNFFLKAPLVWYDENGLVEKEGVWRYVGTYGDCHAFLVIGDDMWGDEQAPKPYPISYGFPHEIYYHREVDVVLYHTKCDFRDYPDVHVLSTSRMRSIYTIRLEDWLTEAQIEELARDIEAISKVESK